MSQQSITAQENPYPLLNLATALALSACNKAKALRGDMTLLIVERHLLIEQKLVSLSGGQLYPTDEDERSDYRYTLHIIKGVDGADPAYGGHFYKALDDDELDRLLNEQQLPSHLKYWEPVLPIAW